MFMPSVLLQTGENKTIAYNDLHEQIEQICEWFCFVSLASVLSVMVFSLCYTGVAYYILDMGVESFYLYPPTKCV